MFRPLIRPGRTVLPAAATAIAMMMPTASQAYIGPGAGLGAIAFTVALGVGLLLLIVGLVWYPLKRLLKSRRSSAPGNDETPSS